ncbi:hypothetical protein SCHPADRAFT_943875 [Schizopora paradoxa]|uniref:DUF6533 domain-containing protein n=1 Tax=Schizopora paradoxa TaxID=27342 RepID=A0A0H2RB75_9AGAM|nr:hypothetical protein SCHPADRAFT_943875 [Schizopora paradoxa]
MSAQLPPTVIQPIRHALLNKYFIISAEAILFYDYFVMLPAEIEHIWMTKWGVGNLLYILTRYTAFVQSPFIVLYAFDVGLGQSPNAPMLCERIYKTAAWLDLMGIVIATNILFLRTAAIWGWSRRAVICAVFSNFVVPVIPIYSLAQTLSSMEYVPSPIPSLFPCNAEFPRNIAYIAFAFVMINETIVLVLTVYRRIRTWPERPTPLLRTLYHDAILFFGCLIIVSALNLILYSTPSLKDFYQLLVQMQNVLHSVSTSRIILHLRLTACQSCIIDGSALLSKEYMKKSLKRMVFQDPGQQNTGDTDTDTDYDCNSVPVELDARGSSADGPGDGEEAKQYLVVNPYMI